ncbi:MAG: hypothetical protein AB7C98_01075 [Acidithiobacillus sp.]|jgi:hypothetical protein
MKKYFVIATLALASMSLSGLAMAADYSAQVGFENYGIHVGGVGSSVPGGFLHSHEQFGNLDFGQRVFGGAGASIEGDVLTGTLNAGYLIHPEAHLTIKPEIGMGYIGIHPLGSHIDTGYAYGGAKVTYQVFPSIGVDARGAVGRDFGTAVSGVHTLGGLYYSASIGADAKVGPGFATISYQYQSMPFGGGVADLNMSTDQYRIGYRMSF